MHPDCFVASLLAMSNGGAPWLPHQPYCAQVALISIGV
jgi:hypothetical protein